MVLGFFCFQRSCSVLAFKSPFLAISVVCWKTSCMGGRNSGLLVTTFPAEIPFLNHAVPQLVQDSPVVTQDHFSRRQLKPAPFQLWQEWMAMVWNRAAYYTQIHVDFSVTHYLWWIITVRGMWHLGTGYGLWHGACHSSLDLGWALLNIKALGALDSTLPMGEVWHEDSILQVLLITEGDQSL